MYVRSIHISGFSDIPQLRLDELGRVVRIAGPSPAATALGDAICLGFAALWAPGLERLIARWGLLEPDEIPELQSNPLPTQVSWTDRLQARWLVADSTERRLQVSMELVLDPPMFAELRALSARAPRLGSALGVEPVLRLKVSAYFAASFDVLSLTVQEFSVGKTSFPTTGKERPDWLTRLLQSIGQRFFEHHRSADVASAAMGAMSAAEAERFGSFKDWQRTLRRGLGELRPALGPGGQPMLLCDGQPLRRTGSAGIERAELAASACFHGADVLWAGSCDRWVEGLVEGEGSVLEQVWRIDNEDGLDPNEPAPGQSRSVLSFSGPAAEE